MISQLILIPCLKALHKDHLCSRAEKDAQCCLKIKVVKTIGMVEIQVEVLWEDPRVGHKADHRVGNKADHREDLREDLREDTQGVSNIHKEIKDNQWVEVNGNRTLQDSRAGGSLSNPDMDSNQDTASFSSQQYLGKGH